MSNTLGRLFRLTTFGESHGAGIGAVIDGCPAGVVFDHDLLRMSLARRRPGQEATSARNEADEPTVLSGVFEGKTTGAPIAVFIPNADQRPEDYEALRDLYRPSHADYTWVAKYGHRDHRGGGRASARETAARVAGGAIARMALGTDAPVAVTAAVTSLGPIDTRSITRMEPGKIYESPVRTDDPDLDLAMAEFLGKVRSEGDSIGGIVSVCVRRVPPGLGEPVYDKLSARLGAAMLSINGATGFDVGAGFAAARLRGSENNDAFVEEEGELRSGTNNSGGIQGGISNGMPVVFRVAFKPPSSIAIPQAHGSRSGRVVEHAIEGRHDPSIVVRAVPVVEAMTWLVLADMWMLARAGRAQFG